MQCAKWQMSQLAYCFACILLCKITKFFKNCQINVNIMNINANISANTQMPTLYLFIYTHSIYSNIIMFYYYVFLFAPIFIKYNIILYLKSKILVIS